MERESVELDRKLNPFTGGCETCGKPTTWDDLFSLDPRQVCVGCSRVAKGCTCLDPVPTHDPVANPAHYTWFPADIEPIDLIEHLPYNRGAACKYLMRAGRKDTADEIEDLKKARWYVDREIARLGKMAAPATGKPPQSS